MWCVPVCVCVRVCVCACACACVCVCVFVKGRERERECEREKENDRDAEKERFPSMGHSGSSMNQKRCGINIKSWRRGKGLCATHWARLELQVARWFSYAMWDMLMCVLALNGGTLPLCLFLSVPLTLWAAIALAANSLERIPWVSKACVIVCWTLAWWLTLRVFPRSWRESFIPFTELQYQGTWILLVLTCHVVCA